MKRDLDALKQEIQEHLGTSKFEVFHGFSRLTETHAFVHWDYDRYPDFRAFLQVAEAVGARLVVFHHRDFNAEYIDDALSRLEAAELPRDEHRRIERRLKEFKGYEGFTCALELSFDYEGRVYIFNLRTEWYEDLLDILDEIDSSLSDEDEEDDEGSMGGYFSRN